MTTRRARLWPDQDKPVIEDMITVLDPHGTVKRQVSLLEAVTRAGGPLADRVAASMRQRSDALHANTVEVLDGSGAELSPWFRRGNVLTSFRNVDTIAIVNLDDGALVWSKTGPWVGQHLPTLLPDGHILVFNNNTPTDERHPERGSSLVEYDPLADRIVWGYAAKRPVDFYTGGCGKAEPLPNGNVLVTESERGRLLEVTRGGEIVWRYVNPHRTDRGKVALIHDAVRVATPWWLTDPQGTPTPTP